jgi:hypothetical protein
VQIADGFHLVALQLDFCTFGLARWPRRDGRVVTPARGRGVSR